MAILFSLFRLCVGRSVCRRMSRPDVLTDLYVGSGCRQISLSADEPTTITYNVIPEEMLVSADQFVGG